MIRCGQEARRGGDTTRPSPESAVNHAVATRSTDRMTITVVGLEKIEARAFNFKPLSTLARSSSLLFDESASWKKTN